MFAPLADALQALGYSRFDVFNFHPLQLASYLEQLWELRRTGAPPPIVPNIVALPFPDPGLSAPIRNAMMKSLDPGVPSLVPGAGNVDGNVFLQAVARVLTGNFGVGAEGAPNPPAYWHQFIYAYLIENTRAFDIFERVVFEALMGERLGTLDD